MQILPIQEEAKRVFGEIEWWLEKKEEKKEASVSE